MIEATPTPAEPDALVNVAAAARIAGVHPMTIRRWTEAGLLPTSWTAGGHRRIRRSDIERVASERRAKEAS